MSRAIRPGLATATAAAAALWVGAAVAQTDIRVGQTITGALTADDAVMAVDGSNYDCYVFPTVAGRTYAVDLQSRDFDAFLGLRAGRACKPPVEAYNDDRAPGETDARIVFTSPGGDHFIFANSHQAGESGAYRLTVSELDSAVAPVGATMAELVRPVDPQGRYMFDITCWLVASRAVPELVAVGVSRQDYAQLELDNLQFYTNAEASGAALGKSADQVGQDVTLFDERLTRSPELLADMPLVETRAACLRASGV